ncbi:DUF1178 family protein [Octadecabacter sp. G9-8]|uniref:DUF1178 family protein n=1 Tax=Octadecabacter dasysiphoniae TaxID=2909341 RepID=A0ABS9CRG6_9RHOB|nr:DUF1178 family protein [Octadecabacter dasysiphoniae]
MIRYTLICDQDHRFESWFQSSDAFDALAQSGHLACAICGSSDVKRAMMAPSVPAKGNKVDLKTPQSDAETALAKLRADVEANSDDVGLSFAQEARKMHDGDVPERPIHGTAKLEEAKKLIDDGIPVAPLPFMPKRKAN